MKTLSVELKTETDVRVLIAALLVQVLDKQNYVLTVDCTIHFEECDPQDFGYVVGALHFKPWGADAFEVMQSIIEKTVSPDYMSMSVVVDNMVNTLEEDVRETFDRTFTQLDDCRSAGSMYTGDNGAFILRYLEVNEVERDFIWEEMKAAFSEHHCLRKTTTGDNLDIEIS